jgi:hypothetical protein
MHAYIILSGCMLKFEPENDEDVNPGFYFEDDIAVRTSFKNLLVHQKTF